MGIIFDADKIYFDELSQGISAGLNFDQTSPAVNWDAYNTAVVTGTFDVDLAVEQYSATEILDSEDEFLISLVENYSRFIDLMEMIPLKFRDSLALQQFMSEAGLQVGSWIGQINDLVGMLDKYSAGDTNTFGFSPLNGLSNLLGLTLIVNDTTTTDEKRRQLIQVIDWYKMKGTYQAIQFIGYLFQVTLNFWDLYTDDYVTFVEEPWFVGNSESENPGGLDPSYYKSPHFGFEIVLDKVYGVDPDIYLFEPTQLTNMAIYVELVRPVNTVPHYSILLRPECDESGAVREVDGQIKTCTIGLWEFTKLYFDRASPNGIVIDNSGNFVIDNLGNQVTAYVPVYFDDSNFFDYSRDAFLNSIVKWELGTGNKGVSPDTVGFAIQTPVLSGSIDEITIYLNRTEYIIKVTGSSQQGLSELGLYLVDGTTLEIASTFPDINLSADVTLKVQVIIYR
jgi:hypothetical protein